GTSASSNATTEFTASRNNHWGLSPPSESGKRKRTSSRGSGAAGSLSANSTTAITPAARMARGSRKSPALPIHNRRPGISRMPQTPMVPLAQGLLGHALAKYLTNPERKRGDNRILSEIFTHCKGHVIPSLALRVSKAPGSSTREDLPYRNVIHP